MLKSGHVSYGDILVQVATSPDMQYVHIACYVSLAALAFVSVSRNWKGLIAVALAPVGARSA